MDTVMAKLSHNGFVEKDISVHLRVEMTENDIFNWITGCDNPDILHRLGRYALKTANELEHPNDDDFRSRA